MIPSADVFITMLVCLHDVRRQGSSVMTRILYLDNCNTTYRKDGTKKRLTTELREGPMTSNDTREVVCHQEFCVS